MTRKMMKRNDEGNIPQITIRKYRTIIFTNSALLSHILKVVRRPLHRRHVVDIRGLQVDDLELLLHCLRDAKCERWEPPVREE